MKSILAALAASLVGATAMAADLPPIITKGTLAAPLPYSWAGCYMAMEAGGIAGPNTTNSPDAAGGMGCNYQTVGSAFVYGFEMDAGAVKAATPGPSLFGFVGNASVRVGYAFQPNITIGPMAFTNVLAYVKANLNGIDLTGPADSGMKWGPGFAAGLESVIAPRTTLGPEYRWSDVNGVKSNTYLMVMRVYGSPM